MTKYKKDKLGWIKFAPGYYKNDLFPNIIICRVKAAGVLYPWGVMSGYWVGYPAKTSFQPDKKFDFGGLIVDGKLACHKKAIEIQKKYKEAA